MSYHQPLNSFGERQQNYDATAEHTDTDDSSPHLMDLFQKPEPVEQPEDDTSSTLYHDNTSSSSFLLPYQHTNGNGNDNGAPKPVQARRMDSDSTMRMSNYHNNGYQQQHYRSSLFSEDDDEDDDLTTLATVDNNVWWWPFQNVSIQDVQITILGSFLSVLYNTVFCLALGSSINRPHVTASILLVPMAKYAALGTVATTPCFLIFLSGNVSVVYPTIDLFLAPFFAHMAQSVDQTLYEECGNADVGSSSCNNDASIFFNSFAALVAISVCLTGMLCLISAKFKLANLGAFLPYPTIAGFFSSIGFLLWTLAFSIDNDGVTIQQVLHNTASISRLDAFLHHFPSFMIGIGMYVYDYKGPFISPLFVILTICIFYMIIFVCGISFEEAQASHWFYSKEELAPETETNDGDGSAPLPYVPFGGVISIALNLVNWRAVANGLPIAFAMAAIYALRNFLHSIAMAKAATAMASKPDVDSTAASNSNYDNGNKTSPTSAGRGRVLSSDVNQMHARTFTEVLFDDDFLTKLNDATARPVDENEKPQRPDSLKLLHWYGVVHILTSLVGGFACLPSVSVSFSLAKLGADGKAPQYGSAVLLFLIYWNDFHLVNYIPKAAFASLLVKAAIDMLDVWFVKSFVKTKEKAEWTVVPMIIVLGFMLGMLQAFAVGVALSTFIFVASFYRSGVVKFIANGLTVRSTIERDIKSNHWLDENADLVQLLVLQNYLFFGNASSVIPYIQSMFEELPSSDLEFDLPPIPKYIIVDLALVTGMDTSAVDVISDIWSLCKHFDCVLMLSGVSMEIRMTLVKGGFRDKKVRYYTTLESALGAAEDILLAKVANFERDEVHKGICRSISEVDDGFDRALQQIDELHGLDAALELMNLKKHVTTVTINAGQSLFDDSATDIDGVVDEEERGIFFIEHGILKIQKDTNSSLTRNSHGALRSLSSLKARSPSRAGSYKKLKQRKKNITLAQRDTHTFRLARIGPGWIVGSIEAFTGMKNPGVHIAVTKCRLYHLPYTKLQEIEEHEPVIALKLVKLLALLLARRQDITVEQMSTLHSIMASRALTKPVKRTTMGAIKRANEAMMV